MSEFRLENDPVIWRTIPGYSTDIPELYADWVREAEDGDRMCEVGVYLGRSLACLAELAKASGKFIRILGVDLWSDEAKEAQEHPAPYPVCSLSDARANLDRVGYDRLHLRQMRSHEAADISDDGFEYVFLDADHRYEAVRRDILAWMPKTLKVLAGHDYCPSHPGVMRAVDELLPGREIRGTCWVYRIPRGMVLT